MVPEPKIIETSIYATVPDELLLTDQDSEFIRDVFHGQPIGCFLEGPSFDRNGNLTAGRRGPRTHPAPVAVEGVVGSHQV